MSDMDSRLTAFIFQVHYLRKICCVMIEILWHLKDSKLNGHPCNNMQQMYARECLYNMAMEFDVFYVKCT